MMIWVTGSGVGPTTAAMMKASTIHHLRRDGQPLRGDRSQLGQRDDYQRRFESQADDEDDTGDDIDIVGEGGQWVGDGAVEVI